MIDWLLTHAFWVIFAVICAVLLIYGWWVRRTSTPEEVQAAKAKKAAWQEERGDENDGAAPSERCPVELVICGLKVDSSLLTGPNTSSVTPIWRSI